MLRLAVICGPTACGKTRLGVAVAHALGSEIISADSRQVYRGLDIGTGKDLEEYRAVDPPVPLHLVDLVSPEQVYTLYHFQRDCYGLLRECARRPPWSEGRPLLMVGGTGLYIEAVLKQYRIARVPENERLREELMAQEITVLCRRLEALDPRLFARTDISSKKRVVRALEIALAGEKDEVSTSEPLGFDLDHRVFFVHPPRKQLYESIDERVDRRLESGMIEEVERLRAEGVSDERLHRLGMEYRKIVAYLRGEMGRDEMVRALKLEIHHLAKRQLVWFRGMSRRGIAVTEVKPEEAERLVEELRYWPSSSAP